MIEIRELTADELELIRTIDRSETIRGVYYYENGSMRLEEVYEECAGFLPDEIERNVQILEHLNENGDKIFGAFKGEELLGLSALASQPVGKLKDKLPLELLYTSSRARGMGLGTKLIDVVVEEARRLGYSKLYISATPTVNTVNFYMNRGAVITKDPDPELLAKEPDDIHLELKLED